MKTYILLFSLFLVGCTFAQTTRATKAPLVKDSPTGNFIEKSTVKGFTETVIKFLEEDLDNYSKTSYLKYSGRLNELRKWMNYQFLIADSEIDLSWFKKVEEFLNFFHKTKKENDLSYEAADSKFKTDNKRKFETGVDRFKKLVEKPTPANKDRVADLKQQQRAYLRQKAAAERAKKGQPKKISLGDDD